MIRPGSTLLRALCLCVLSAQAVAAQGTCLPVRPNESTAIHTVADLFLSPDYQAARTRLQIATLPPDVAEALVTENSVCAALYRIVSNHASAMWEFPTAVDRAALLSSLEIRYYRVGDYYVADLESSEAGSVHLSGRTPLMTIRRPTMQYLGVILQ